MNDSGSPELSGARPGSGKPKIHDSGSPELPEARPGSGEPKLHDSGSLELPRSRPGSGKLKMQFPVRRNYQEPGLPPLNQKCMIPVHRS